MQRSDLNELRKATREGRIRRVYVFRLDRLTRTGIRDTLDLIQEFERNGCEVVTIAHGFELTPGPFREVVIAVMAWGAQIERLAINERISAARERVEAKGGRWGRPRVITDEQIATARAMQEKGKSLRAIAKKLRVQHTTLSRALGVVQKDAPKWGPRAIARGKLRRLKKQGETVDLRKTKGLA